MFNFISTDSVVYHEYVLRHEFSEHCCTLSTGSRALRATTGHIHETASYSPYLCDLHGNVILLVDIF